MAEAPEPMARGRYALIDDGGSLVVARSVGLCETCAACGCGEQLDPIQVPAPIAAMARKAMKDGKASLGGFLKATRRG